MNFSHHRTDYWLCSRNVTWSCTAVFIFTSVKLTFYSPNAPLQLTTLSHLSHVSRNLKFSQRYCKILSFVPMRQLGKHFIISWTLIGLITVTLYNRQYISMQGWVMDPITLPSILQCWLNAAEAKGHLHLLLQALCSMCSLRATCVVSAHTLNLNQPLISQSVRHWAVPVSYGPFRQQCPWGTWVSVLMTWHTIFITVTCSFMAPAHISELGWGLGH